MTSSRSRLLALLLGFVLALTASFTVPASAATVTLRPGTSHTTPKTATAVNLRVASSFTVPQLPSGGPLYIGVPLRAQNAGTRYHALVRLMPDGAMRLDLRHVVNGTERTLRSVTLPQKLRAGQTLTVEGHVVGSSPVSLAGRAWIKGSATPGWQVGATSSTSDRITRPGLTGATAYLSGSARQLSVGIGSIVAVATSSAPALPSTSPAPAPAPAPAPSTGRPSASTTGVPAGTSLKVHYGNLRITTAGTVVDAMDIRGFLRVEAPNVVVKRSVVRGGKATRVEGVVTVTPSATNFVIQDSEVYPSKPSVMLDGIKGANFTARRVHVHGGVDNIKVHGSNVLIEDSYLHDPHYFSSDPLQGGKATHNDGVQILGGTNIRVIDNTIDVKNTHNAAVQVTQDFAKTSAEISRNHVDGGQCSINLNHKDLVELRTVTLRDNRFGRDTRYSNCGLIATTKVYPALSGNLFTDGSSVPLKRM
ncbi:hypothetical protein [Aquipuribacter nitratireducens]|uniref:Right handed beta helix domain-containing protein n=1 Tax=Aquipuribacter nitratireducens TaxID=650104 RepID=A0ABW0GPI8_9MICO